MLIKKHSQPERQSRQLQIEHLQNLLKFVYKLRTLEMNELFIYTKFYLKRLLETNNGNLNFDNDSNSIDEMNLKSMIELMKTAALESDRLKKGNDYIIEKQEKKTDDNTKQKQIYKLQKNQKYCYS